MTVFLLSLTVREMNTKTHRITRNTGRVIGILTEGLFSRAVDVALWLTIYIADLTVLSPKSGKVWRAQLAADRFLQQVNYEIIKNAIITAKRNGWIKKSSRHAIPEITTAGKRRLANILPQYDEKRTWDGRVHLVAYDIPETKADDRHLLREILRSIGCGRLQGSLWITPYNPIDILRSFIEEHGLVGTIIVSDIGKDGAIGEEDIRALIARVYKLHELNDRYVEWLKDMEDNTDHWMALRFLTILEDDPQIPFSLLPPWWKGDTAYHQVRPFLQRVII